MEDVDYRRIFRDVCLGYTPVQLDNLGLVYIKHLNAWDQVALDQISNFYYSDAQARGVPTEREMLDVLIDEGQWSKDEEKEIKDLELLISSLYEGKKHLLIPSKIEEMSKEIKKKEEELSSKLRIKESLLGKTCEKYANDRTNDYYIIKSLYKDSSLNNLVFSDEEFDDLSSKRLSKIVLAYNSIFQDFSELRIQELVLQEFFYSYLPFGESTKDFFGKPACELSYNQLKLIIYLRVFKNIFDNNDNIPDNIRKDPKALIDFANSSDKLKNELEKDGKEGAAKTIMGAKGKDLEQISEQSGAKIVNLRNEAIKKGGTLNMDDFMRINGV